jgi:hypothetical protein
MRPPFAQSDAQDEATLSRIIALALALKLMAVPA